MRFARILLVVMCVALPALGQGIVEFTQDHLSILGKDGAHHSFAIELALNPAQHEQGLMYRRTLASDAGMLFDFHAAKPISMWMKNTFIPLDMIFIGNDGHVVGIAERTIPQSLDILSSPGPVRAVLEVNGGTASRMGIKVGDLVEHPMFKNGK